MARRPVTAKVETNSDTPTAYHTTEAKRLYTIDVPMGGLGLMQIPNVVGCYVRLRPMPGATPADMDATARALGGALGVLRMPVAPVGVGAPGDPLEAASAAPTAIRGETLEDALAQACELVLDQEGVKDPDERAAVTDAAFDTLRKVGV